MESSVAVKGSIIMPIELLVGQMVRALVDRPTSVQVIPHFSGDQLTVAVTVAADDLGKVIGKQGRTARSLRAIAAAAGRKLGVVCTLDIQLGNGVA